MDTIRFDYGIFGRIISEISLGFGFGSCRTRERAPSFIELMSGYEFLRVSFIISGVRMF